MKLYFARNESKLGVTDHSDKSCLYLLVIIRKIIFYCRARTIRLFFTKIVECDSQWISQRIIILKTNDIFVVSACRYFSYASMRFVTRISMHFAMQNPYTFVRSSRMHRYWYTSYDCHLFEGIRARVTDHWPPSTVFNWSADQLHPEDSGIINCKNPSSRSLAFFQSAYDTTWTNEYFLRNTFHVLALLKLSVTGKTSTLRS